MAASAAFSHARYLAVFTRPPRETFKNRLLTDGEKRKIAEKGFTLYFLGLQPFAVNHFVRVARMTDMEAYPCADAHPSDASHPSRRQIDVPARLRAY